MNNNITFVGLDVHKDSIDVAFADYDRGSDVRFYGTIAGDLDSLHKVIQAAKQREHTSHCLRSRSLRLRDLSFSDK